MVNESKPLTDEEIKQELFEQWLDHPITKAMMNKAVRLGEFYKKTWMTESWQVPIKDLPRQLSVERLAYLRGRSSAFKSLTALKWSDLLREDTNEE